MQAKNLVKNADAIIFDFDGTLVDSLGAWEDVDKTFFAKRNMSPDLDDYFHSIMGLSLDKAAELTIKHFNLQDTVESVVQEWRDAYKDIFDHQVQFIKGAEQFIQSLVELKKPFGIASACALDILQSFFAKYPKIEKHLQVIVSCDEVQNGKPSPDVFIECRKRMNMENKNCVIFEDSLPGVQAGVNAKMPVILIKSDARKLDEKLKLATFAVNDYTELL